jgi:DNA-binding transcriptional LysR family regulator
MVRQLEDEIGQPLLIRDGRQLRLTDVGKVVFARGQDAVGVMRRLTREVADLTELSRGELTVGMPPMVNLLFPPVVKALRATAIRLPSREAGGQRIEQRVAAGELEVGATLLPVAPALGLATRSFGRYPLQVVGPRHAAWARARPGALAALRDEALILLEDDFSLTRRIREAFGDARFEPRVAARAGSGIFWWRWPPPAWAAR